ncbi:MAG: PmbA protein [Candidatus Binatota bacterium]|jgi:PmbA protein|nr:PmbA protein [Candidatus Binatota bacterium]
MDLRDAVEIVLEGGGRSGASDVEVVAAEGESLEVGVRLGEVEKLKRSRDRRLAIRSFCGSSSAVCSTADLSLDSLRALAGQCAELARATAPDPFAGLPEVAGGSSSASLDLFDARAESFTVEDALALAKRGEAAALESDPRLSNSEGAEFRAGHHRLIYATSRGVEGEYRTSRFSLSVVPVAKAGDQMERDYWYASARHFSDLDPPEAVGAKAAERTLRRLGARAGHTKAVPVVFDPETSATLLGHLAAAASGSTIYRGTSFLAGRLGERLAPPGITVVDDPLLARRLGSRPFDGEGLATRRNVLLEDGVFRSYLLDTYSGRKLGMESTASAVRSLAEPPSAGPSNLYLVAGAATPEEIVASVTDGLYVTELIGFGVNPVTGDYSRGAAGLWIENGRLAHPVHEVTIAGNLLEMFRSIELVGNDLEFRSTITAPTLKIAQMTVAGA